MALLDYDSSAMAGAKIEVPSPKASASGSPLRAAHDRESRLKIYGERNTGTNYLRKLVARHLDVHMLPGVASRRRLRELAAELENSSPESLRDLYFEQTFAQNLGWKHSLVRPPDELLRYDVCSRCLGFVTLSKNPYSWLLSLHERPYHHRRWHCKPDFESFLVSPWGMVGRDNAAAELPNPVELWNCKNASYLRLDGSLPVLHLTYERLLADPLSCLEEVRDLCACCFKRSTFRNVEKSTKEPGKNFELYRQYYLQERWRDQLSPTATQRIDERLDEQVMRALGYNYLS